MRKPLIAGNWKLNGSLVKNQELVQAILSGLQEVDADMMLCPPSVYLQQVLALAGGTLYVGAQDAAEQDSGAYTGETSAQMLADLAVQFVLLGHSERRSLFGDNDTRVANKFIQAVAAGLTPVLCLGESLAERESKQTEAVVARQLNAVISANPNVDWGNVVLAYEPVWAIGTGMTATPQQAQEVHQFIRELLQEKLGAVAEQVRILYGGSVKPDNAAELFSQTDIDGGLIGGASLKAADFLAIAKSI
jgi:triosephosphate isomerase